MRFCQNQLILYRDTANFGSFLFVVLCYQERTEIMKQIRKNPIYHPHHTQIQGVNTTKDYLQVDNNRRIDNDNRRTKAISGNIKMLTILRQQHKGLCRANQRKAAYPL